MSEEGELNITSSGDGMASEPSPVVVTHPERVSIKYQGLTISLQDLLNKLNDADLLPTSVEK